MIESAPITDAIPKEREPWGIADAATRPVMDHLPKAGIWWSLFHVPMGGTLKNEPLPDGGLQTTCQGCGAAFTLITFVDSCPECGGVHAVSPPRAGDPASIQFAGVGYRLIP
jgi:hypothetical protein